jgi:hypothetical protein
MRSKQVLRGPRARSSGLPIRNPDPEFLLRHHHGSWVPDAEGNLVPVLHPVFIMPGVDLIDVNGDHGAHKAAGEKEGWVYLEDDEARESDTPDGLAGYLRSWATESGAEHHTTPWQKPELLPGGEVNWHTDQAGYRAWLRALVERGRLRPPSRQLLQRIIDDLTQQAEVLRAAAKPAADAEAAAIEARVKRLAAGLTEAPDAPVAPPKPAARSVKPSTDKAA